MKIELIEKYPSTLRPLSHGCGVERTSNLHSHSPFSKNGETEQY